MRSIRFMGDRLINEKVMSKFIFEKKRRRRYTFNKFAKNLISNLFVTI